MNDQVCCWAVIPAAGIGERIGADIPKQYLQISGKTILEHALNPFLVNQRIKSLVIALNDKDTHFSHLNIQSNKDIITVTGGQTRAQSVLNALLEIKGRINSNDFVLVHDAARPCLTENDLNELIDATMMNDVGGILASPIADTVKKVSNGKVMETLDRSELWRAYTPQMFRYHYLLDALSHCITNNIPVTDEASAIEALGLQSSVVLGDSTNIKVTTPNDLVMAEKYLGAN
jgi:2-C-methyl-D-erythritol 4-phosphate cytidylyltransferase